MSISVALLMLATLPWPAQNAQAEYESYLARFERCEALTGAMMSSAMGENNVSTFRVRQGGLYAVFRANLETHYDGKLAYTYSPDENKYVASSGAGEQFGTLFGRRFACTGEKLPTAVGVSEEDVGGGRQARVFELKYADSDGRIDLVVSKDKGLPLALRFYGQQGMSTTRILELHLNRKPSAVSWEWSPPKGATKTEFLRGN